MVWSKDISPSEPGYAIWQIFPASASQILREFLVAEAGYQGEGDPIHSQSICMTPSLLERLYASRKVRPFTIKQYCGDAVYIPAGCAHQVCQFCPLWVLAELIVILLGEQCI